MQVVATDFPPAPRPTRAPWGPGVGVGGALFATFALGFTEGCLEIERRPIPLRFALRFAAANVLPSAVWSSVPARHVAVASGVPSSALVGDAELAGPRSVAVGRRLVLLKSVRALRLAVGSYGLAWSLWRVHSHDAEGSSNNNKDQALDCGERVVRLAPVNSPLSRASRRTHGDEHFVSVPVAKESWKRHGVDRVVEAVDWEKVGIAVPVGEEGAEKVRVIEVELSDAEATMALAGKLKARAARGDESSTLCSVAVLPPRGPPLPTSITDSFDVCFNPLSAVLTFIASVCRDRGVAHAVLVADEQDENIDGVASLHVSASQLAAGLLYRHGISATVLKPQQEDPVAVSESEVVFIVSENLDDGRSVARKLIEHGLVAQEDACFIVNESLRGQNASSTDLQARSALLKHVSSMELEGCHAAEGQKESEADELEVVAKYVSVADVSDQTLQGIRTLLRRGQKPDAIQAALYEAYGTQRVVTPHRRDQFSNMNV
ncbi:Lysosomal thioesterase PPT2-B [Phytophthora cinnamomi]|uniref:Lysosomal thioesterase PPT2-B n=1 Tax=Phytophthora cinnamomi TaxID=4785 RepID=UPI0035594AB8|nr:Lysosomal thioesterase PPT2-B [Phytophthora cinnamomi]